jgi:hypothetical protein
VAANAIYGCTLAEYRTIFLASVQLFRVLLLDFNYAAMYKADSTISALFFVTYVVSNH